MLVSEGSVVLELPGGGTVAVEPWSLRFMICTAEVSIAGRPYTVDLEFVRAEPEAKWTLAKENLIDVAPLDFFTAPAPELPRNAEGFIDPKGIDDALRAHRPDEKLVKAARRTIKKAVLAWVAAHPAEMREIIRRGMVEDTAYLVNEIEDLKDYFYRDTTLLVEFTNRWQWTKYYGQRLAGGGPGKWKRALRSVERAIADLEQTAKWIGQSRRRVAAAAA
jgi:hypothetical protein